MTPEQAAKLRPNDRVWVQADSLLPGVRNGVYSVLETTETIIAGRKSVRVRISDDPEIWVRPSHLGRVSRGQ